MIEAGTAWELLERRVSATPEALVLVDDRGDRLTFRALRDEALSMAGWLHGLGVRARTVVSWQLPNWLDSIVLVMALARLGAVQNPIVPIAREREVGFMTKQLDAGFLITPGEWRGFDYGLMAKSIQRAQDIEVVTVDRAIPRGDASVLPPPPSPPAGDEPVRWVVYTSGTTADPKGARHTDSSVFTSARCIAERMQTGPDDRIALVFPFAHIGGVQLFFGNLMSGSAGILVERFDHDAIGVLGREGVTFAGSSTAFHQAYLKAQEATGAPIFPRIRGFMGGGATRPHSLRGRLVDAFGDVVLLSGYGSTETGSLTMADCDDPAWAQAKTEGRPYECAEVRVVREDGSRAEPGEEGELIARGPQVMRGYVDPALDTAFDDDGFFHTGDLGVIDEQGFVHISGRIKDIIIRKGENISAREIEELLDQHPRIAEVAVVGLPDEERGERVCAAVVLAEGAQGFSVTEARDFLLGEGVAVYKAPEQVEIVESLPRNMIGKVVKPHLRDQLIDAAQPRG